MRTRSTLLGALALTAILAACGGGGSTPVAAGAGTTTAPATAVPAGSSSSTSTDQQSQRQAYSKCLQDHGVTAGALGGGRQSTTTGPTATTVDPNVLAQARQACANLRPSGGFGAGPGGQGNPAMQAYFDCLAQHGVTVPTTVAGATTNGPPPTFDRNDPTYQAAQQACASLRPQRGNGTTTTITG